MSDSNQVTLLQAPEFEVVESSFWEDFDNPIVTVSVSNDATVFLGSSNSIIHQFDLASREIISEFKGHQSPVWTLVISPDGTQLLSSGDDHMVILWDIATQEIIQRFEGHAGVVYDVAFLPDGQTILSASNDRSMRHWDIMSGEMIRVFDEHILGVIGLDIDTTGSVALTSSLDETAKLWLLWFQNQDLIEWANQNLKIEPLSCEERAFYQLPNQC